MKHLLLLALTLGLFSCSSMPITHINNSTVPSGRSLEQVAAVIKDAAKAKRWRVVSDDKKIIVLDIQVRSHYLKVNVPYSTSQYSILFKDSKRLGYEPGDSSYHKKTYGWMRNLDRVIQKRLSGYL